VTQQAEQVLSDSTKAQAYWQDLGITTGVKNGPQLLQAAHTSRPTWKTADENRPNGSVWFKTTKANPGANIIAKLYTADSGNILNNSGPIT